MSESTPPSRASVDDESSEPVDAPRAPDASEPSRPSARRPLRLIDTPMRTSQPSFSGIGRADAHPPSEPRPLPGRPGADAGPDRPARVQLIAALLLLLVLVVVPLYLWRRPRAATTDETKSAPSALAPVVTGTPTVEPPVHTKNGVTVSDAKVIGCHDPGSKRTPADQCDHLPGLEAAISKAILDASGCVPEGTPAGEIAFVVDASYARRHNPVRVRHHRDDTTLGSKAVAACVADVKKALASTSLDQAHAHARYDIEVDATYGAKH